MPVRTQAYDGAVEMGAYIATHAHDHGLAVYHRYARLKVLDQVTRHLLQARLRTHKLFQRGPLAFGFFSADDVFFVFNNLFNLLIERVDFGLVNIQFGQTAFVENRHCCAIIHGILDVIDANVVTKHFAGITVFQGNGRACKAKEGGVLQCVMQMFGIAKHVLACLGVQPAFGTVLAAMGLIGYHHDIGAIREQRMRLFLFLQREFLHRGEDDAARLA
ncbi:hypothetical protein D3C77_448890 [compost metagenome]